MANLELKRRERNLAKRIAQAMRSGDAKTVERLTAGLKAERVERLLDYAERMLTDG